MSDVIDDNLALPPGKRPHGRPFVEIDCEQVERLAQLQCSNLEICAVLGISKDTLARRRMDTPEVSEAYERGRAKGRASLRRLQWQRANNGSDTMLIWLGKQVLGQTDRTEHSGPDGGPIQTSLLVTYRKPDGQLT